MREIQEADLWIENMYAELENNRQLTESNMNRIKELEKMV